jgi:hypothetical protein
VDRVDPPPLLDTAKADAGLRSERVGMMAAEIGGAHGPQLTLARPGLRLKLAINAKKNGDCTDENCRSQLNTT